MELNEKQREFADLIGAAGWSQAEAARQIGLSRSAVSQILSGKNNPDPRTMHVLRTKVVEAEKKKPKPEAVAELREDRIIEFGNVRIDRAPILRRVPVVSWTGAAAITEKGLNFADLEYQLDETVETESRDPGAFALIVEGDSMAPEVMPGDRVVFAPNEEPRNGDIVVARLRESGAVLLKRFYRIGPEGQRVKLESVNKDFKDQEYGLEEFRFIYPAVDMKRVWRR